MPKQTKSATASARKPIVKKERRLQKPTYRSFRLSKRIKYHKPKITGGYRLFAISIKTILKNKKVFAGTLVIAFILNVVFVRGFANITHVTDAKALLMEIFNNGRAGELTSAATIFAVLLQNTGTTSSATGAVYQSILFVMFSLVYIWVLRNTLAKNAPRIRIRDGFYKGMYPLITFTLVLMILGLQLLPIALANFLYGVMITGGIAVTVAERVVWFILIFLLIVLAIYMISSSIFALYVVALPDITPWQAIKSAGDLVRFRRWTVMRKVLVLPLCLIAISGAIMLPIIIFIPVIAEWVFYLLTVTSLLIFHSYFYNLYRELL